MEWIYNHIANVPFIVSILFTILGFALAVNKGKINLPRASDLSVGMSLKMMNSVPTPSPKKITLGTVGIVVGIIAGILGGIVAGIQIGIYFGWLPEKYPREVVNETVTLIQCLVEIIA